MSIVLFAALLHAGWNSFIRASSDKFRNTLLIVLGGAFWMLLLLPALPLPAVESLPYIGASVLIHAVYFSLVAFSYRDGELSFVYPLMRGLAPALSAIAAALFIGESSSSGGWIGVFLISLGILLLTGDSINSGSFRASPAIFAVGNACVIVLYTIVDGKGVRLSGNALSYTGWIFLLTAPILLALSAFGRGISISQSIKTGWRQGLLGGACTFASYAIALWAMTRAPIALVAALRETSVVFAAIIASSYLKEPVSRLRYASILTVFAGAVLMKIL